MPRSPALPSALFALAAALIAPVTASATGGQTIAAAPNLPVDTQTFSGWSEEGHTIPYGEYWRAPLTGGDRLTMDLGATMDACSDEDHGIMVYSPSVTDYTVSDTKEVEDFDRPFDSMYEFVWRAPFSGNWTLYVYGCVNYAYQFTAHVATPTQVKLNVPRAITAGKRLHIKGTVKGVQGGQLAVTVTRAGKRTAALLIKLPASGRFALSLRLKHPGGYRVSARYYGDSHHLRSTASAHVDAV
jgi:hypothetical protein